MPEASALRYALFLFPSRDYGLLSAPLSYVRSGDYRYYSTELFVRGSFGYYWSLRSSNTTSSYYLYFGSSNLSPQYNSARGTGFAVRHKNLPRLRPPQRPIIVCEEWHLLELYGAQQQRFARLLLVASFQQYCVLQQPVLLLIALDPSELLQSRLRVCGAQKTPHLPKPPAASTLKLPPPATTASSALHYHM